MDFKWNGEFPKKKNWALANVPWKNEWVFILDAGPSIDSSFHVVGTIFDTVIKEGIERDEADKLKGELEEAGGSVEVK